MGRSVIVEKAIYRLLTGARLALDEHRKVMGLVVFSFGPPDRHSQKQPLLQSAYAGTQRDRNFGVDSRGSFPGRLQRW
jgi:hypothetical protein